MPSASEAAAMQTLLSSVTQALPTNGAQPLISMSPTPLPTTPASALQVVGNQLLPVINPNAYRQPAQPAWYARPAVLGSIGLGVVGLGFLVYVARRKKRK